MSGASSLHALAVLLYSVIVFIVVPLTVGVLLQAVVRVDEVEPGSKMSLLPRFCARQHDGAACDPSF